MPAQPRSRNGSYTIGSVAFSLASVMFVTAPLAEAQSYILDPVGPEVIWDQTDQNCADTIFTHSYASAMGFLRSVYPPGGLNPDYWNADGTEPTAEFIDTGAQHLYWLDQIPADGADVNGLDLKYWTTTDGTLDNYIKVHFRRDVSLPGIGVRIPGADYTMGPLPVNVHPPPDSAGHTAYFIRMHFCDTDLGSCLGGYLVAELEDEGLPVDLNYSNLIEGTQLETQMPGWPVAVASARGKTFGVAMSLNEGWLDDGDHSDDPTMGWYLASHDPADCDRWDDFLYLDKDADYWTDPVTGGACVGPHWDCQCDPDATNPTPESSIYLVLWAGWLDCNGNGVADTDDIAGGTSQDEDIDGRPDECQIDCNGNGWPDYQDDPELLFQNTSAPVNPPPADSGPLSQDIHLPDSIWLTGLRVTYRSLGDAGSTMMVRLFRNDPYNDTPPVDPDGLLAEYDLGPLEVTNDLNLLKTLDVLPALRLPADTWMEVEFVTSEGSFGVVRKSGPPSPGESSGLVYNRETQQVVSQDDYWHLRLSGILCFSDCNANGVRDRDDVLGGTSSDVNGNVIPDECECFCGDVDHSGGAVNLSDFASFAVCYGLSAPSLPDCDVEAFDCSDLDGNGTVNLGDFATFAVWYGQEPSQVVPNCTQE